jgi:hypothetical protein
MKNNSPDKRINKKPENKRIKNGLSVIERIREAKVEAQHEILRIRAVFLESMFHLLLLTGLFYWISLEVRGNLSETISSNL